MAAPLKWFPVYVDDVETDETYRTLTWEERGVFWSLIFWEWREGSVPSDARLTAKVLHAPRPVVRSVLALCFNDDGTKSGRLVNRRLEQVRNDQYQKSARASAAGSRSAATRREQKGNGRAEQSLERSRIRSRIRESLSLPDQEPTSTA
jgi:uncharacterized protein YdaU (DUF1376 family)